jgi:hypothetical protein
VRHNKECRDISNDGYDPHADYNAKDPSERYDLGGELYDEEITSRDSGDVKGKQCKVENVCDYPLIIAEFAAAVYEGHSECWNGQTAIE